MASPRPLSLQLSRSASASDTTDQLSGATAWSEKQETRLQHCRAELEKAQKRWSASQDLWIEEYRRLQDCEKQVEHLLELKKAHLKAMKKQQTQANKATVTRRKRTWKSLSRTSSKVDTIVSIPPENDADDEGERDDDEEEEEEEDGLTRIERTDSTQELPPPSPVSPHKRRSSLSNAVRRLSIVGLRGKRKVSAGDSSAGPSAGASAGPSEVNTPTAIPEGYFA